ncbi:hypothetical protein B0H10DRAFT_1958816 [Mycena sp. CBHHK59/15]|nr:hypothetical protein B0H10DRAFT_1958816 [Mycena sp. CBHHK59/15]
MGMNRGDTNNHDAINYGRVEYECKRAHAQVNARTSHTSQPSQIQTPLGTQVNLPSQSGIPPLGLSACCQPAGHGTGVPPTHDWITNFCLRFNSLEEWHSGHMKGS